MNFLDTFTNLFEEDKKSLFQKNSRKKISLLFSFLLIAAIFYAQGDCSQVPNSISGFIYMGEHNGSKYFCSDNNNHNWLSAKTSAAANGGHLVVINDQSENDFIKNGIMASAAWIGYSDEITEGSFVWMNGSQSAYTNWWSGEPNNQGTSGGQGDYTVIEKSSGQWKDREGSDKYEYVMEIPCPTPPTGPCMNQLAYWNLNACSPGSSYNELTASTSTPNGFSTVSATILSNSGDHSCSPSPYDKGICHAIRDYCSFSNNHSNAYKFSVTIKPQNGFTASLSKLSFYEAAPDQYNWTSGGSGDNDPPSKYGVRVLANGTEIFKQVDISTSSAWSLEEFDFSNEPDFTVTTQTTFSFELLGYCRQGSFGYAVWDLDEVKVFGCSEGPCANAGGDSDGDGVCDNDDCAPNNPNLPATPGTACDDGNANTTNDVIQADGCSCAGTTPPPCANQGGDSDGDGICNNQDCAPNDPTLPATPGTACNDGNPNTINDVIQADGCSCAGTPSGGNPDCEADITISTGNGTITVTGLDGAPVSSLQIFTCDWSQTITSCFADCGATKTVNVSPGCYLIYAKYYTAGYQLICEKQATVTVDGNDPCANAGGDSDGDGVCDNDDCQPNNPAFPATPGTSCNDGNPNTTNDVVQADGCSCAGTPVQGCDNITDGGTIGFDPNCLASVSVACNSTAPNIANCVSPSGGSGNLEIIWLKSTSSCSAPTTSADDIIAGLDPHWVLIPGQTGLSLSPGVVSDNTCYLRCTRRAGCSTYQESNIISLTTDCGGGGNPNCDADISITTGNGTITVTGLDGAPVSSLQIFSCDWSQTITNCFGNCGASKTVNVAPGCYLIYAKYYTAGYQLICEKQATVTVGGNGPCANAGGDSDGDGICDNDDCQPNNPAFPATPGTACNDGNPNTTNDVVQADGCSCVGTPTGGNPDCENDIDITVNNGTITVTGLDGAPVSSLQIFSCDWSQTITNCFADCGASKTVNVAPGCYLVYAKYYTAGYQLICEKQATVTVDGNDPCANAGGDSDGDGVCDNNDCQPNNPAFPATPGTPCNDGNPNTENDVVTANGCGCAGTPVNTTCTPTELVRYDMDACHSCSTGSNADWSEFAAAIINNSNCQSVTATGLTPVNSSDNHSCTPGAVNNAMCVGQGTTIQFSVTLNGNNTNRLTGISFYEQAPNTYLWETAGCGSPVSGSNNRPTKFDLKVYKGGSLVFSTTMNTQTSWNLRNVDFSNDPDFVVNGSATYTFKFTPYNALGFGSVKAWDLDEIKVMGCCDGNSAPGPVVDPTNHPKFVNELPAIPRIDATNGGTYNIGMEESSQWLGLQDANGNPVNSTVWGYTFNNNQMYLGPTFLAKKDKPINVKWINNLPMTHLLPVDESIHKARPNAGVPTVVHLHGGHTEPASDGYPEAWFTQNFAEKGGKWVKETYHYDNDQEAAPLWYHDHTLGMTRLNVYAGLAGMYLLRDNNELSMNLPTGAYERELVIQDKQFTADGSQYFPALLSDPEALDFPTDPNIEPTIFPEFFGDYILVNGRAWPKMQVEATKYRYRLLNASDSRFYIFKLSNNASFQQIGTDGGFLNSPVTINQLVLAPGERADIVIDFSGMQGQSITLLNVGPDEPFKGLAANQPPADPNTTGVIMQFKVGNSSSASFQVPNSLRQPIQFLGQETNTRQLLLLEGMDQFGRLRPSLGTAQEGKLAWVEPITENPVANETEIWEVYNNTEDAHPIHIHQISFQLVNRQEFTGDLDPVTSQLTNIQMVGSPIAPPANESGWKDTYIVPPGHVARFKVRFDIPGLFVWHCHILSHEDWDMMRPLEVLSACAAQGGDNDGDGVCANQDCNDYDASVPAAPGTACNDGNANTINDVIQADGCTCAGTPNNGGNKCKIGDLVWHDTNNDGKHDSNEPGLVGVWINLLDHLGNSKGWTVTGSDGSYLFDNLDPGDYKIKFSTPGGYIPTTQHAGNDPTSDSDIGFWTGMTDIFTLTAGQWQKDCDAGYKSGQYLIGNPRFEFEAVKGEEFAQLYWLHNESYQVDEYILERSADGNDFTEIYNQFSKGGNSNELYEAFDIEPLTGDNFYRVKMINLNGSIQYSEIKVVSFPDLIDFVLFPNPANDFAKVNLETVVGKKDVTLTIFNNLGVEIKRFQLDEVYSKYFQMDIRELKEGHYIVWLNLPGHKPLAKQLVVGKI